jgi:L-ascorbate metabolism protein UlaG (beta-lactamase superfamily)
LVKKVYRIVRNAIVGVLLVGIPAAAWVWQDRPVVTALGPYAESTLAPPGSGVTVTWFGVSTLLFDDGQTQLLVDGFFSRPSLLDVVLDRRVSSNAATINYMLDAYGISRLAAVITAHSHFDHAMDAGAVAVRTDAVVMGSASTANIARGAGVPENNIRTATDSLAETFGQFTVRMIRTRHAPASRRGEPPIPGKITAPLAQPAPISSWKEGDSYTIVIEHPLGNAVVQASAGFIEDALKDIQAGVVFLGVALLTKMDDEYVQAYWREAVVKPGATRVIAVHYDDFLQPLGEISMFPRIIDDPVKSLERLQDYAAEADPAVVIRAAEFGKPLLVY